MYVCMYTAVPNNIYLKKCIHENQEYNKKLAKCSSEVSAVS